MTEFTDREWNIMTQTRSYTAMLYCLETFRKELESNTFNDAYLYDAVTTLRNQVELLHFEVRYHYEEDLAAIRENREPGYIPPTGYMGN